MMMVAVLVRTVNMMMSVAESVDVGPKVMVFRLRDFVATVRMGGRRPRAGHQQQHQE